MGDLPNSPGKAGAARGWGWAVLFPVSDAADLVTGSALLIDGGWTAQSFKE